MRACLALGGDAPGPAPGAFAFANVRWIAPTRPGGPARDGEIDLLVVDPAHGILVVEVKDGPVRLDGFGRWYAGERALDVPPFRQAETSKHAIADHVAAHPDCHETVYDLVKGRRHPRPSFFANWLTPSGTSGRAFQLEGDGVALRVEVCDGRRA